MSDATSTPNSKVTSTSVKITLNAKSLGLDAFLTLEETHEFINDANVVDAAVKREEVAALLTEQLIALVKDSTAAIKAVAPIAAPAFVPAPVAAIPANTPAAAPAVMAAANGAVAGGGWAAAPDRFNADKQVRFMTRAAYSSEQLKANIGQWLVSLGFNPAMCDVWDERNDAEKGMPVSSIATVKVKKEYHSMFPGDVVATANGGSKAIARVKFNNDGTLYCFLVKEAAAADKYGALNNLKGAVAAPVAVPAGQSDWDVDNEEAF
jgi:hypothetical protein